MPVTVHHGDCLDVLAELPDASVDAVVTDPPYGLEFMGKDWDSFAPRDRKNATVWDGRRQAQDGWQDDAAARSGKGGGGPSYRSQHKGAKRCTLCGKRAFSGSPCECPEPAWVIEHRQEAPAAMLGFQAWCTEWSRECYRVLKPGGHLLAFGGTRTWHRLACAIEDAGFEVRDSIAWLYGSGFPKSLDVSKAIDKAAGAEREATGRTATPFKVDAAALRGTSLRGSVNGDFSRQVDENGYRYTEHTAPATPAARQWQGWGTALRPAFEPIVVARKPLAGTVAANVLTHGTGALNIDGCRVGTQARKPSASGWTAPASGDFLGVGESIYEPHAAGRWPTNVALDDTTADQLDAGVGDLRSGANEGGPSRFFPVFRYEPKAPTGQRPTAEGGAHPTVKPLDLMRWLIRLVTPPGGTVLDPFAGSGTTGHAAALEGVDTILIEREAAYLPLIAARLNAARWGATVVRHTAPPPAPDGSQTLALFDLEAPA